MRRSLLPLVLLVVSCSTSVPPAESDRADGPDGAAAYAASKRTGTDDPHRAYAVARDAMRQMRQYATNGDTFREPLRPTVDAAGAAAATVKPPFRKWQYLGPGNIGGRTRALVIDPVEPQVMFAGGVSGGVWRTTNAGGQWRAVGDAMSNIAVNSLVMHPTDRNTLYAGTGEGYFREEVRGTGLPLQGNGIFVTRDRGNTWTRLAATENVNFHYVNDLVISAHDPSRIYAATRTGVWRSRDAGATWTQALSTTVKGGCLDLAWRGNTSSDYLFASCGIFEQATVYRNEAADAGASWQAVLSEPFMGRTSLAIAPSNPSIMYAVSATNEPGPHEQGLHSVWRSDRSGEPGSWRATVTGKSIADPVGAHMLTNAQSIDDSICGGPRETPFPMGWYTQTIAVDPKDPERVWVGSVDLFRSDDGGVNWGFASYWWAESNPRFAYVHADQHSIVFHPHYDGVTNRVAFFTNDGGIARTDDARAAVALGRDAMCRTAIASVRFEDLNNEYGVTQFYHGAVFPDGRRFIAGAQDNGTLVGTIDDPQQWRRLVGGDGGYVAVDQHNPLLVYAEIQWGLFRRSTNGGMSFTGFPSGLSDNFLFIAPFVLDPTAPENVWYGGTRLWRSQRGNRATSMSAPVPGEAQISAIAVAPGMSDRVVAGTNKGHIIRSDAAGSGTSSTEWPVTMPRVGFVSSVIFDPVDPNVIYATYAGFGGAHVWMSTDGGVTWSSRDGSGNGALPDIPVHSLAVDPTRRERLYLGTDLGVFVSLDGGASWAVENSGFAAAVTEHVVVGEGASGKAIYAFTHGRGAWRAELTVPAGPKRRAVRP